MSDPEQSKESFAALFEKEGATPTGRRLTVGEAVRGRVVQVNKGTVIVDIDGKQQGFLELLDVPASAIPAVDDTIDAFVASLEGGEIRLSKTLAKTSTEAALESLRAAFERGVPVDGKVVGVNKGGLGVEIGGLRCFCPSSQIDLRFVEDKSQFLQQTLSFLVTEIRGDRDVVLSRRKVLELDAAKTQAALLETLVPGAKIKGRVTRVRDFGAFVDLGGIDGLIPARELSHERKAPEAVVSTGDVVEVVIEKVDLDGDKTRISLSLKALTKDPWEGIEALFRPNEVVRGQVSRVADFGAFVRLASGIEGLLHVSELGARISDATTALSVGQQLLVVVKSVDVARKRLSLAIAPSGLDVGATHVAAGPVLGQVVKATVEHHERFGIFVQIAGTTGREGRGLIPFGELNVPSGVELRKEFPLGAEVTAKVVETGDRRLRLSIKAALDDAERADFDAFKQREAVPEKLGSFGALLAKKLGK